jgi:hypothetical protein
MDATRIALFAGMAAIAAPLMYGGATLHIGFGAGTPCAQGCAGEPNTFSGPASILDIYQESNASKDVISNGNLLLILAVPAGETAPPTSTETDINPYPGGTTSTGAIALTTTKSGFDSGELYSFLGLKFGDNSNNFVNISGAESTDAGLTVSSFAAYEYTINSTLGPNGLANITFGSDLPVGTFAIAYGCQAPDNLGAGGCSAAKDTFSTPFTEADLVTPEPSAIILLGTSVIGIGGLWRRRFRLRRD